MVEAILFDFDGVIRQWDEPALWNYEEKAGYPPGTVFAVAFDPEVNGPAITGKWTWQKWKDETRRRLTEIHGRSIWPIVDQFFAFEGRIDPAMRDLLGKLQNEVKLGLLTNNHDDFERYLSEQGLESYFDFVGNTCRLKVAKPDPAAYLLALEALKVQPAACLFVDDLERNVQGALAVGMRAFHFTNKKELLTELNSLKIFV
ncbi:MAG: HAD family phosphatase [Actinomycetota bacterium]|nr:HAD family phosphatase [Actinomycetota bacterium]MDG1489201.1 HAD family phosphatase [Actinomycetota bacterium]MDG2121848.1 HAD family phosphatase [Actinomycetota bacterium]